MSTAKHFMFCSGPMGSQPVTALPGIGPTYESRLNQAGYYTARDLYDKFKSFNFDSGRCQGWLGSICNANSNYSSMCYQALREWHQQFGQKSYSPVQQNHQPYRHETPEFGFLPKPSPRLSPERIFVQHNYSPVQQSSASSSGSDISKAEVTQMMTELRNKQDEMAIRISHLEEEKSTADSRIKTLEAKIQLMDMKAVELKKKNDAKIAELSEKMRIMDRIEQYKSFNSSIYLLNQKYDELLTELNKVKESATINCYVKALERKIDELEKNKTKLQKQQDEKFIDLSKKISDTNTQSRYKEVTNSINLLAQKFDEMKKQQENEPKQDKSFNQSSLDDKMKHMTRELSNLSMEISNLKKKSTKVKKLSNSENKPSEIPIRH